MFPCPGRIFGCVEEDIEMDIMNMMREILKQCDPMDAKFDKIRAICNDFLTGADKITNNERVNTVREIDGKYVKFMVLYNKPGNPPNVVPWTGIDQTMEFVEEKLEDGYVVQVKPFTKEQWSKD